MNAVDKHPDYNAIYQEVKRRFQKTKHYHYGPYDETYFSLMVFHCAKQLAKKYKCRKNLLLAAALLHDIGKIKLDDSKIWDEHGPLKHASVEWSRHPKESGPLSARILKTLGHSEEFITEVKFLVENHNNRHLKEMSIELKILQDADLVADCGLAGFTRSFGYGGRFKHSVINQIFYLNKSRDRVEDEEHLHLKESITLARQKTKERARLARLMLKQIQCKEIKPV